MKKLSFYLLFALGFSLILSSCGDDEEVEVIEPTNNIVQIAQANGFNSLAAALTKAGLVDALQGSTNYTVFAPTDEAFSNLLTVIGQTSIDDVPAAVLEQILLYHVVQGKVLSSDITSGDVTTLEGSAITLSTASGITVNGVAVINPFDVEATNGVVHTINEVLVPASVGQFVNTVLEPAYFNEAFSTLISAAVKAGVVETLLTTPDLTIFAPNNEAFIASGIDPSAIDAATLASVLTYHVVGAKVLSSGIPSQAVTVNGNELFFSLVASGNFINGATEIIAVDIESGSGVVHVINSVLLPPSGNLVETAVRLSAGGEFTSLIAALTRTADEGTADQNLINVLSGTGPFTVFAPTNAAFQALLDSNNDWASLGDIPLETLISVLTYHVVPAKAFDKDIAGALDANGELPTAFGQNIGVDLGNFSINGSSNIIDINYNATNGVIHVIDAV
ncbi:MAG: transforming growth factor-beta-induced protein, partial [Saprospiraceae bacterium]